ncbi:MAG: ParB/RepB/Spo0J family partition protein [Candidatus Bathyarchaeia archaeon]
MRKSVVDESTTQGQVISELRRTSSVVGRLYPVIVDSHGRVIDGEHRLKADPNWFKVEIPSVESEEQRLLARLISNVCRRDVSSAEKTEMLRELGRIYLQQGVSRSELVKAITRKTGMSYRWVMKYAPDELKLRPGLGGPKSQKDIYETEVAWLATGVDELLLKPSERVARLTNYSNTNFVTIMVEKQFYLKFKEAATELGVDVDVIINNALLLAFQKVKKLAKQNTSLVICAAK